MGVDWNLNQSWIADCPPDQKSGPGSSTAEGRSLTGWSCWGFTRAERNSLILRGGEPKAPRDTPMAKSWRGWFGVLRNS